MVDALAIIIPSLLALFIAIRAANADLAERSRRREARPDLDGKV